MNYLPNDTIFNAIILVFLVVLIFSLATLLVFVYRFLSKWITFLQRDSIAGSEKIKQGAYAEASRILDSARNKSMKIVSEVSAKAQSAVASIDKFSKESKAKLTSELDGLAQNQATALKGASNDLNKYYEETLSKQKQESIKTLEQASHDIEESLLHEVDEFKDILHKETVGTQKEVEAKIQQEYSEIELELKSYKERQFKALDQTIYDILHDVSKQVFGEALSMEDHQELVIKSLSEAKENNVFSKD